MTRAALLLAALLLATACAGAEPPGDSAMCGALPAMCECEDWECQFEDCETACYCDTDTEEWTPVICDRLPPDAGPDDPDAGDACPNAIASDERCPGSCVKAWGSGASYCAAPCAGDDNCAGMSSGWGVGPLVCHPDGYCTASCAATADCALGDGADYACDDGRCTTCDDCF